MRWIVLLLVMSIAGSGCIRRSENEVVIYCSVDREFATPILDAHQRAHSQLDVARQFDIESTKSVGLANRILAEKARPNCDVFWNGEILQTIRLHRAGLLAPRVFTAPEGFPANYIAKDRAWASITARARVLLVNREKLPDQSTWPTRVAELADVKWNQTCGLASPLFGTTSTHMVVLAGRDATAHLDWLRRVRDNAIVLSGNKQVAQAVSKGDLAWGLTDTDDALIEIQNGAHVQIVFPDQSDEDSGALLIPSTVSVLRKCPHPVAARELANNLFSEQTASRLTMGAASQFNLWEDFKNSSQFSDTANLKWMEVDYEAAGERWEEQMKVLESIFR